MPVKSEHVASVYGASGHGLAVADMLRRQNAIEVIALIDDTPIKIGTTKSSIPVISFSEWSQTFLDKPCFVSSGNSTVRRMLVERVLKAGGHFTSSFSKSSSMASGFTIGIGSGVWEPLFVGPHVNVGNHVQVMPMTSLGHDVVIGDFATVCPGCTISGHVVIEEGAFIGAGSVITNGSERKPIVIGRKAQVGACSFVSKSVAAGAKVLGNPARPLRELASRQGK